MKRDLNRLRSKQIGELEAEGYDRAYQSSVEGMVLLENNGVLPMKPQRVALFGFGARHTMVRGIGSGDITLRYETSVEKGLLNAGFSISSGKWLDRFDALYTQYRKELSRQLQEESERTGIDELHLYYARDHILPIDVSVSEEELPEEQGENETAIYVLTRKEGEGIDNRYAKGEYLPKDTEIAALKLLRNRFGKLILLLNIGSPIDMQEILAIGPDAVLLIYQGTAEIGNAAAALLTGKETPSGKLPATWAVDYFDFPNSREFGVNDGNIDDELYREGLYIGYRYFDSFRKKPLYPFGYGLSYTTFSYELTGLFTRGSEVLVDVRVENIGRVFGKAVVQLYISLPAIKLDQPVKQLVCYGKTDLLHPGDSKVISLSFHMEDLASFSKDDSAYLLEKGEYLLWLGACSTGDAEAKSVTRADEPVFCGCITLTGERITRKTRHLFTRPIEFNVLTSDIHATPPENAAAYPQVIIDPDSIPADGKVIYADTPEDLKQTYPSVRPNATLDDVRNGELTLEELVSTFSNEELIHLVVGEFYKHPRYKMASVSTHIIGACGETTNYFLPERAKKEGRPDRKIPYTVMADGPAGLRLIPRFQADAKGNMLMLDPVLNYENGDFSRDPGYAEFDEGYEDYYQYVTGLPIGVQLASTWNQELLYDLGDQVGSEMELYGVDTLLAPGINLHRNPICGRNFEYYSEDPVLTAFTAISFIRGVEHHPGKLTCAKHFAANNQEAGRCSHNAVVDERTMRDLYLKAFELTVKYANPGTVMTALNCLNGVHNTNNIDLSTYVLRDEWGYKGLVMTDWNTSSLQRGASTIGCVNAGNDLIMPGADLDYDRLRQALDGVMEGAENLNMPTSLGYYDGGELTIGALQRSAVRVLRYILQCDNCSTEN